MSFAQFGLLGSCLPRLVRHYSRYTQLQDNIKKNAHKVYAFGLNDNGQCGCEIGIKEVSYPYLIPSVSSEFRVLSVGTGWCSSFLVNDLHRVYSWGYGPMGCLAQLHGGDGPFKTPTECQTLRSARVKQVVCGRLHTLFLTLDHHVLSVGNSELGQLGSGLIGEKAHSRLPLKVEFLSNKKIIHISTGLDHCLALNSEGRVWCWYDNIEIS
jgi:alpha-tubulin suppressor-like RCC1 family protein